MNKVIAPGFARSNNLQTKFKLNTKFSLYPLHCTNIIVSADVKKWCQFIFANYNIKTPSRMVWSVYINKIASTFLLLRLLKYA